MLETTYRGYRIRYHCTSGWFTHIYPPGSGLALGGDIITATREEGEQVLLSRACARIDHEETNTN